MKTIKFVVKQLIIGVTAVGILAGLVWTVSPTLSASAASAPTEQPNPAVPGDPNTAAPQGAGRLALAFRLEHLVQNRQATNLERADRLAGRVQTLIDRLRDAGQDVAPLEQALEVFNASITTARGLHDQAGAILASHPGFDGSGKVTDLALARQTVKNIHDLQVQTRQTIQPAFKDLKSVLQTYRQPNASQKNTN
jgi:hypothetical protein